jgi:hypothetical protein
VADRLLSLALREMRAHLGHSVVLATLAALSLILGLSGPFTTYDLLRVGPRIAYWTIVVFGTYGMGTLVTEVIALLLRGRGLAIWQQVSLTGFANGVFGTAFLMGLNALAFPPEPHPFDEVGELFGFVLAVSLAVSAVHALADWTRAAERLAQTEPQRPALLDRLPLDRRGGLVSITVQDHYVEVTTTSGSGMVLMRLSDAIREAAPEPGLQVHRSHWVALSRVTAARRTGDTAVLTLSNGREVPVSRGKLAEVQAAGLLPVRTDAPPPRMAARG